AREGERIGGVKIIPFVTRRERLEAAERVAAGSTFRVRRFLPMRVAVLVEDTLEDRVLSRARRALDEKLAFFGSDPALVQRVRHSIDAIADVLRKALDGSAQLVVLAGGEPDGSARPLSPGARARRSTHGETRHSRPTR